MKGLKNILGISMLLGSAFTYGEEVRRFSLCELNPGKTMQDLSTVLDEWAAAIKKDDVAYNSEILVAQAAAGEKANSFWLAERAPSLIEYAQAYDWWYTDPDAVALQAKFNDTFTCTGGALYRVMMTR